jgi:predicted nucleic acid-binding protein
MLGGETVKVVVDSSSWIEFIRGGEAAAPGVAEALREGTAAMTEPVWAELWSGARGGREERFLEGLRDSCAWLSIDGESWDQCYRLRRGARQRGLNCPLADVLVVACARRHGAGLLHRDKHLDSLLQI